MTSGSGHRHDNLSKIFFNQVCSIFTRMRAIIAGYVRFAHLSRRLYDVIIAQSHVDTFNLLAAQNLTRYQTSKTLICFTCFHRIAISKDTISTCLRYKIQVKSIWG